MERPYILDFEHAIRKQDIKLSDLPDWCEYPLAFASQRDWFILPEIELVSQQLIHAPFFIDFVQLNVTKPVYIPFHIFERQLFLYFMLKGRLLYVNEEYRPIIRSQSNHFLMSYYDEGKYYAFAEKGIHICLVVSILPEWIEGMYQNYPNLQDMLYRFKNDNLSYDTMYHCRMDRRIHKWLYKIYSYSQNNIGALDGNLRKYISYVLEYYDSVKENENTDLAYKVRTYIQDHYYEQGFSVNILSEYFFVTSRTLLNIFKRQYHITIQEYITELRVIRAMHLMQNEGLLIKDVYSIVGYSDERTFRVALERFHKRK